MMPDEKIDFLKEQLNQLNEALKDIKISFDKSLEELNRTLTDLRISLPQTYMLKSECQTKNNEFESRLKAIETYQKWLFGMFVTAQIGVFGYLLKLF